MCKRSFLCEPNVRMLPANIGECEVRMRMCKRVKRLSCLLRWSVISLVNTQIAIRRKFVISNLSRDLYYLEVTSTVLKLLLELYQFKLLDLLRILMDWLSLYTNIL